MATPPQDEHISAVAADSGRPSQPTVAPGRCSHAKAAFGIFAVTLLAYLPAIRGGFVWDDDGHVTRPDLRSLSGLWRIWSEPGATQQYYPVLHSAFWVEHRLWGDAVEAYHLLNILLHATAACLFGLVLQRLWKVDEASMPRSYEERGGTPRLLSPPLFAALLFALHPVCVESVAWISEQKNTLSTVFYLLAALAFLTWHGLPAHVSMRTRAGNPCYVGLGWYVLSLALFILAILSKSVTATLPAALLVIFWWQRGTLSFKRDFLPLLPFFAIGIAGGLLTAWVERQYIGARGAAFDLSLLERGLLAGRVIWFYLAKLIWPANLMFVYPRWQVSAATAWPCLYPLGVIALLAVLWLARKRARGPLAGVLFFVGSLFPALGFFNVYPFVFSYVADHFQYLASLGIIALVAGAWARLRKVAQASSPAVSTTAGGTPALLLPIAIAILCILGVLTFRQCETYRDSESLYRATLQRNPDAWLAHDNLGVVLAREGRLTEAIAHYREALRLNPNFPETYNNYGNAMAHLGQWSEATAAYARALALRPQFVEAEYDWGNALSDEGIFSEAVSHYETALRLRPDYPEAQYRLANALGNAGQLLEAIGHYQAALRLRPAYAEAHANLGLALNSAGRLPEALVELETAVRLSPNYPEAHAYLGLALAGAGQLREAVGEYRRALRLRPGDADVHYQLGVALRALGETEQAEAEFEAAGHP